MSDREIIPAGECGEFTITAQQIKEARHSSLTAFWEAVETEALRRGLALSVSNSREDGTITVKWRPKQ